jgi:hypothetical protein
MAGTFAGGLMRKRSFVVIAAVLLLCIASIRADEGAPAPSSAKPWDALWHFDTHG